MLGRWISLGLPVALLSGWLLAGCSRSDSPLEPVADTFGTWPGDLKEWLQVSDGAWLWRWSADLEPAGRHTGSAVLSIRGEHYRWRLNGITAVSDPVDLRLTPADTFWLGMQVADLAALSATPPLPRLAIDSPAYPDLVAMLRDLLTPRFDAVVTHWPGSPVPVGSPPAQSGDVDLAACLREAVTLWNTGETEPLFVWTDDAAWGVRLAHYAGSLLRPPLQVQLTRHDADGRPLRMRIAAGDNYSRASARPYAVRGLAHELGHCLFLWGHSPDRTHLLWGAAPPLRADPSLDERRAVRLLQRLPAGLDLRRYGCETDP